MAKVLITSVGTGDIKKDSDSDYVETTYNIGGKSYTNTLTSQVIVEHFNIDKIYFIGTVGSMWDNLYFKYDGENEGYLDDLTKKKKDKTLTVNDLEGLNNQIDIYLKSNGSKCFLLNYGKNDSDEVWSNFEKILEIEKYLSEDDEIYLDITHGFRYMPILNIFALEFLSQLNERIKPKAILYGMFAGNKSEILDFNIFFELLEWAKAIEELEKFASLDRLVRLSNAKIDSNGYNVLISMKDAFNIAYMTAIYKSINNLNNHLNYFTENENCIIKLIAPRVKIFVNRLASKNLSDFQFKLARFFANKNNYALAYIALAEAIVSYVCEKNKLNENSKNDRQKAKDTLYDLYKYPNDSKQKKFIHIYDMEISKIRNNIAHQLETTRNSKHDIENFDKYFKETKKYLKEIF
jgi:CRISPR-associated Csx2 family protein